MAELKPAYLIHGDDHGAVAERRAGLRALAERQPGGAASVEVLEGDAATPANVAQALATMTLPMGGAEPQSAGAGPGSLGRVIIVDGVERWRQADVEKQLLPAMGAMPPETTLALFAREEQRATAPAALRDAIEAAGGQVVAQMAVKPWELASWVREQATRLGLELGDAAAKALVAHVGERQQRLLRELEKLALEGDPAQPGEASRQITVEDVERRVAHSAELRSFELADALVAADARAAVRTYLRLRQQGERLPGLTYRMAERLREGLAIALRLAAGEPAAEIKRGLRTSTGRPMPAKAAARLVAAVERSDPDRLRAALAALADLELDARGGAPVPGARKLAGRTSQAALDEETLALRAIEAITR
jgi:DNA polymerase-3 subunit delta